VDKHIFIERNFSREVGLFSPPRKEVKQAILKEWVVDQETNIAREIDVEVAGYRDGQRVVYIPTEFVYIFSNLPHARLALAALTTLYLRLRDQKQKDGKNKAGIKTTLGELCRTVGLTPNGPRRMQMKEALIILHQVRYRGLTFFNQEVLSKHGKQAKIEGKHEVMTVLVPHLEFLDAVVDGHRRDTTVVAHLCPALTQALDLDAANKTRVPVAALQATYGNT